MRTSIRAATVALSCFFFAGCGPDYPACDDDDDCQEGEFCVNDLCQQCRDANDCPAGQTCNGGRCDPIEGWCAGNGDCGPGEECRNNRCVASSSEDLSQDSSGPTSSGPCSLDPVFFAFDSDELDSSTRDALGRIATCIRTRNVARVHVTGYTDPRGTEEYNLALGDRRARAVMQYLTSLGVTREGLSASSMGEEMAQGEDESGWRNDRKVTFTER